MPIQWRGLAPDKERGYICSIQRENQLRLEWYWKNQEKLNEMANEDPKKQISQEAKDKFEHEMEESFKQKVSFPRRRIGEPDPIEARAQKEIMKPVDPSHTEHIYRKEVGGRREYFKQRTKVLPENRFYVPETSSSLYGWKMYHHRATQYGFGREFIIKHSFYRRQGVQRDPDWYREPE